MDREALVYVDLDGVPHLMGRLWARTRKNKESATFEYDKTWLENPARFSLEPALQVGPGPFHTPADTPMFGAIGDSAPDRWGRALMRRMERRRAEREGGAPRTLQEIDFLMLVQQWNPKWPPASGRLEEFKKFFSWSGQEGWKTETPANDSSAFIKLVFGSDSGLDGIENVANQYRALFRSCDVPTSTQQMIMGGTLASILRL